MQYLQLFFFFIALLFCGVSSLPTACMMEPEPQMQWVELKYKYSYYSNKKCLKAIDWLRIVENYTREFHYPEACISFKELKQGFKKWNATIVQHSPNLITASMPLELYKRLYQRQEEVGIAYIKLLPTSVS